MQARHGPPLYFAGLFRDADEVVPCSDAFRTRGSVCGSPGLAWRGLAVANRPGKGVSQDAGGAVGVLALSDGMGGFRRALDKRCVYTLLDGHTWRRMVTEHPQVCIWVVPASLPWQHVSSSNRVVRNGLGSDRSSLYRRVVRLVKKGLQHCSKVAKVWLLGKNMAFAVDGWASLGLQPWCLSARLDRRASFPVEASNSRLPTFARAVEGDRFAQLQRA